MPDIPRIPPRRFDNRVLPDARAKQERISGKDVAVIVACVSLFVVAMLTMLGIGLGLIVRLVLWVAGL